MTTAMSGAVKVHGLSRYALIPRHAGKISRQAPILTPTPDEMPAPRPQVTMRQLCAELGLEHTIRGYKDRFPGMGRAEKINGKWTITFTADEADAIRAAFAAQHARREAQSPADLRDVRGGRVADARYAPYVPCVVRAVATYYALDPRAILVRSRVMDVQHARCMVYLLLADIGAPTAAIARLCGMNHSTISHMLAKHNSALELRDAMRRAPVKEETIRIARARADADRPGIVALLLDDQTYTGPMPTVRGGSTATGAGSYEDQIRSVIGTHAHAAAIHTYIMSLRSPHRTYEARTLYFGLYALAADASLRRRIGRIFTAYDHEYYTHVIRARAENLGFTWRDEVAS